MNADDDQALIGILLMPLFDVRLDVATVVASERPEFDHDDFSLEVAQQQRSAVQPGVVRNLGRFHPDSRIGDNPGQKKSGQQHAEAHEYTPCHRSLLREYSTCRSPDQIYLAIAIAGVGYFVRSVTVI